MNAIEIKERVDFYMDTTRNARFTFLDYNKAINDAIEKYVVNQFGDQDGKSNYSFESTQQVRDNLFTIIKQATPSITTGTTITTKYGSFIPNHINNPTDYFLFVSLQTLIGGITCDAKPTTYNELITLFNDSFRQPSNEQPYYLEDSTGYKIYRGSTGTLTTATLTYIKAPATFSIGSESQLLNPGVVLTIGLSYIAIEESVSNSVTYQPSTQFTATSTTLTSGQVILASNTTTCDLPDRTHNDIAKIAAEIMAGVVSDYNRSAFDTKESKGL